MSIREERAWAGSQASYEAALDAETRIMAGMNTVEPPTDEYPRLLSVSDGLAVISIKGPLMNNDSWMLRMFGATGYPEIRDALVAAVNDPEVKQILLDCDSGGGAVSGCDDTGNLIRSVNKVKPVTAYGDTMASAMYWLACSAGRVYSSKSALVGSIGVKATFREYTKQNEQDGVSVTVIRAGKYKALADPNEKLTPEAKAQIQAVVDAAYGVFVDHVAEMRGKTYAYTDKTMADGQEFIGQAAVDVGLTDGITTFDAVVGGLKKKILASLTKTMDNHGNNSVRLFGAATSQSGDGSMGKRALTEQDIAALAAGGSVSGLVDQAALGAQAALDVQAAATAGAQAALDAQTALDAQAAAEAQAGIDAGTADTQETADTASGSEVAKNDTTVQLLVSQIQAKDEALLQAGIKLSKVEDKLTEMSATFEPLVVIASKAIGNMTVALGGSAVSLEGLSSAQIVAEHTRVAAQFQSKFKVGGVSTVDGNVAATQAQIDPRHKARVNAVRFQK